MSDAATGETTAIRPEDPLRFAPTYGAEFSPDGSTLATSVFTEPVNHDRRFPRQNRPTGLALVDLEGGEVVLAPDSQLGGYGRIAWSADGRRVYFSGDERGEIKVYDLSAARTAPVPFDLHDEVFQLAAF